MNKLSLLAGIAIGAVLTAGVAQLRAQAPGSATTTRPAVFVITEQTFIDEKKYMDEFAGKAVETIKAAGGRFIVRANEVSKLSEDATRPSSGRIHPLFACDDCSFVEDCRSERF